jgi:propanediol dehydratase small subunit
MTPNPLDIERVVRQVLAELGLAPTGDAAVSKPAKDRPVPSNDQPNANRELVLTARVVTLGQIEGRLTGVCRLAVPQRAVVTPAVRDELKHRNILLTFAAAGENAAGENAAGEDASAENADTNQPSLAIVAVGTTFDPKSLTNALAGDGVEVTNKECNCLIRAIDDLAPRLAKENILGILVTEHAAAGLCLANRHQGVRAVLGSDPATTASDVAAVGANLLVVDPRVIGPFQLKQMATQFCRSGPAVCPEVFGDRLR